LVKEYWLLRSIRNDWRFMKPYVIASPQFDITSGGIRVMWGLYGWLLAKGQIVYMNQVPQGQDVVAIYPEIQQGNPVGAKDVVRYILNKPGVMGAKDQFGNFTPGPTTFDPNDKIYVFSKIYDTFNVDFQHILFLPIINTHLFKDQKKKRTKTCYLIGKGHNKLIHPKGSIEITRAFAQDQQALADLLNECEVLYGYDKMSAMYEIARLCGCRVKYYGGYDENEIALYEPGINGFGVNGDDRTLYTEAFREHYLEMIRMFEGKLDQFIEETQ
jgi:hypothetical protein